jgi:multidrug efflux pump subunit AcrB
MTGLALRNPIAVLMVCIGLIVFAGVVTPRMAVDTLPELTPPVLVVGTLAPGLGPKDMEKTITWRIEKYVSATPGVDHVESTSRNNLSIVFVWMKWGTDLNAAQTLVQQQVQFAMAAVPKSLGVLPPFVLQYDPSNAPVVQVAVWGEGFSGPELYDYAFNNIEPQLEGISGVASASLNGGRQRQINIVVDPVKAQARGLTAEQIAHAVAQSNALLPSGEFLSPKFDANVYTNAIPKRVAAIGDAVVKNSDGKSVLIRDVARVEDGGSPPTQDVTVNGTNGVYLNVLRVPGGNTLEIVEQVKKVVEQIQPKLPPGMQVKAIFDQSTFVRTAYDGLKTEVWRALVLITIVILVFLQTLRGTLIVSVAIPLPSPSRSSSSTRTARRSTHSPSAASPSRWGGSSMMRSSSSSPFTGIGAWAWAPGTPPCTARTRSPCRCSRRCSRRSPCFYLCFCSRASPRSSSCRSR